MSYLLHGGFRTLALLKDGIEQPPTSRHKLGKIGARGLRSRN
jgi:hypothetical protein